MVLASAIRQEEKKKVKGQKRKKKLPFFCVADITVCLPLLGELRKSPGMVFLASELPTCASGYWLFGFASKKYHPVADFKPEKWNRLEIDTKYYTTNLHMGAFMLPRYVEALLEEEEERI